MTDNNSDPVTTPAGAASSADIGTRPARRGYPLHIRLARRPLYCCGCFCLHPRDARRLRRIGRLVRAITRTWR